MVVGRAEGCSSSSALTTQSLSPGSQIAIRSEASTRNKTRGDDHLVMRNLRGRRGCRSRRRRGLPAGRERGEQGEQRHQQRLFVHPVDEDKPRCDNSKARPLTPRDTTCSCIRPRRSGRVGFACPADNALRATWPCHASGIRSRRWPDRDRSPEAAACRNTRRRAAQSEGGIAHKPRRGRPSRGEREEPPTAAAAPTPPWRRPGSGSKTCFDNRRIRSRTCYRTHRPQVVKSFASTSRHLLVRAAKPPSDEGERRRIIFRLRGLASPNIARRFSRNFVKPTAPKIYQHFQGVLPKNTGPNWLT